MSKGYRISDLELEGYSAHTVHYTEIPKRALFLRNISYFPVKALIVSVCDSIALIVSQDTFFV